MGFSFSFCPGIRHFKKFLIRKASRVKVVIVVVPFQLVGHEIIHVGPILSVTNKKKKTSRFTTYLHHWKVEDVTGTTRSSDIAKIEREALSVVSKHQHQHLWFYYGPSSSCVSVYIAPY